MTGPRDYTEDDPTPYPAQGTAEQERADQLTDSESAWVYLMGQPKLTQEQGSNGK